MRRPIGALLPILFVSCTPDWRPIDVGELARSQPRSLLTVYHPDHGFLGFNPGFGGVLAYLGAVAQGHTIREENHLVDPAQSISRAVAEAFAHRHHLSLLSIVEEKVPASAGPRALPPSRPPRPNADLTLEIETLDWGLAVEMMSGTGLTYQMRTRLLDNRTGRLLADGECGNEERAKEQRKTFITTEELLANDATRLKRELAAAEAHCISEIGSRLLLVPPVTVPPAASSTAPTVDAGSGDATND